MSYSTGAAAFAAHSSPTSAVAGTNGRNNGHVTSSGYGNPLYSAASRIPLIKSPSVSVPAPIRLPSDLHPLPPDISAYFVYPFSLESYVLDPKTPSSATIAQLQESYEDYLRRRHEERQLQERQRLQRLAPGWADGGGGVMVPDSKSKRSNQEGERKEAQRAPIDDLVDHLAKLEAMDAKPVGDSTGKS
ncbi:hypothetical protein ACQY0O_003528 [Thecaphora frezii]